MRRKERIKRILSNVFVLIVLAALSACGKSAKKGTPPMAGYGPGGYGVQPSCAGCPTSMHKRAYSNVYHNGQIVGQLGLTVFTDQTGNVAATGRYEVKLATPATCGLAPGIYQVDTVIPGSFRAFGDHIQNMRLVVAGTPFGIDIGIGAGASIIEVNPSQNNTQQTIDGPYNYYIHGDADALVNNNYCQAILVSE